MNTISYFKIIFQSTLALVKIKAYLKTNLNLRYSHVFSPAREDSLFIDLPDLNSPLVSHHSLHSSITPFHLTI